MDGVTAKTPYLVDVQSNQLVLQPIISYWAG